MNKEANPAKNPRLAEVGIRGISLLFLLLGLLKLHGVMMAQGTFATFLQLPNPIVSFVSNGSVVSLAAVAEILIGYRGLRAGSLTFRGSLLLWFVGGALLYKVALIYVNYRGPCGCLFGINKILPLSAGQQRSLSDLILFLTAVIASTAILYDRWLKRKMRKTSSTLLAAASGA